MMIRTNFHTHTTRCKHASGADEAYIQHTIDNQFSILGFSDHGPYEDNRFGYRMNYAELEEYISTMKSLKKKYADQIQLRVGLEIEYNKHDDAYFKTLLIEKGIEYLALGQHIYLNSKDEWVNTYFHERTEQHIEYATSLVEGMKSGYYSFVCHPDLFFINDLPYDENTEKACDIIIEAAQELDMVLEYNANGYRREFKSFVDGDRYPYPHLKFWEKVSKTNIRVLINADAHSPSQVYDEAIQKSVEATKALGLNVVSDYK